MTQTAVEWLEDIIARMEAYGGDLPPLMVHIQQAKEIEKQQQGYSDEDMKSFADWCRNGLLNSEYSVDRLNEHLEQWKQFKNK